MPDRTVSLAEAKTNLSALVSAAESGEVIAITKRGKLVAELRAQPVARQPVDLHVLQHTTDAMTAHVDQTGDVIRRMRDDARY